jgi:MFS transporter, UMF1 family
LTADPAAGAGSQAGGPAKAAPRALVAWAFYDWANSAFPTVIQTFLFSAYFTTAVAVDETSGTALWGNATSLAAIAIALASPVLGAIADQGGRLKPWLATLTLAAALATAALWFVRPDPTYALFALVAMALGAFGFELGTVFYNAFLPAIAPARLLGRISGWAWGLGYAGGLACMAVALLGFIRPAAPVFGLDPAAAEPVRAVAVLAALWMLLFALPLFLFVPDRPATGVAPLAAVRRGLGTLGETLRSLPRHANVARFLLAKMIYIDGLNTLFAFGGIYAAGSFGFTLSELLLFGILLNVTAGLGAAGFAWLDDRLGAKPVILISLGALTALGLAILAVTDRGWFYGLALAIGIFLGPTQAASRSLMARLAPPNLTTEFFGLYAFAGKATAFLGPAALALATTMFASQRAGMATIPPFFVVGFLILLTVKEPKATARRADAA